MEYVPNALPITAYARDRSLPLRARVELFLQVLDGVNHAHQRGIIHRDLKPANILVGIDPSRIDPSRARDRLSKYLLAIG